MGDVAAGPYHRAGEGGTREEAARRGQSREGQGRSRSLLVSALGVCLGVDSGSGENFVLPRPDQQHKKMKALEEACIGFSHSRTHPPTYPSPPPRTFPPSHVSARLGPALLYPRAPGVVGEGRALPPAGSERVGLGKLGLGGATSHWRA